MSPTVGAARLTGQSTKPLEQVSHHLEELIAAYRPTSVHNRREATNEALAYVETG
jgi:hypothetical protein